MGLDSEYAWALAGFRMQFRHTQPPAMLPSSISEHFDPHAALWPKGFDCATFFRVAMPCMMAVPNSTAICPFSKPNLLTETTGVVAETPFRNLETLQPT